VLGMDDMVKCEGEVLRACCGERDDNDRMETKTSRWFCDLKLDGTAPLFPW
jgi:hypothetical protein